MGRGKRYQPKRLAEKLIEIRNRLNLNQSQMFKRLEETKSKIYTSHISSYEYFQYLIHSHKKGLQNQNIFPRQIKEFPMPSISPEKQIEILNEINEEFSAQDKIKQQIEDKRKEIDGIIKQVLK